MFAFEELENNLHPALMRRLFAYLIRYVEQEKCMLVLTTHSNVALDVFGPHPDAQIIHVTHDGESASSKTVEAHFDQVGLLAELGARPSDLLQANGVVWLEGPSDRIYFNRFIELFSNGELREGRHYQCAFYGGSNLARSTFSAPEHSDETFANLLRLNHNVAVVCDGDRTAASRAGSRIKKRVQRIKQEVENLNGAFLWITEAKELENYIPGSVWSKVYKVGNVPDPEKFDRFLGRDIGSNDFIQKHLKRKSFDKCDFAANAVEHLTKHELAARFEFKERIDSLVEHIRRWNR
ncbi:MAG: AAA family ATPase [Planctomycetaceae bacterium]